MDNKNIIKSIAEGKALIMHSERWRYPSQGDDERKCPMLKFMMQAEQKAGTLIFVPDIIVPKKIDPISHQDVFGKKKEDMHKEEADGQNSKDS